MSDLSTYRKGLEDVLVELCAKHKIPGSALAVYDDGDWLEIAHGVTNVRTQVEFTTDTVYLIGSISKVWTATAVMQLAEKGIVDLDVPIGRYMPELRLQNGLQSAVTLRHLLSHSSGITGDYFLDTGRGDESVARYVSRAYDFRQLHEVGALFSYGNSGFVIAGRLLELVTGKFYREVIEEGIVSPLGLRNSVLVPEQALLRRVAAGHLLDPETGQPDIWPTWHYPWSMGPAGASICCTPAELLKFSLAHLPGGGVGRRQLVSDESARLMQQPQINIPYQGFGDIGLGWMLMDGYGTPCFGHGGGSPGGFNWLFVLPERDFAFVWFANLDIDLIDGFGRDLQRYVFETIAGVSTPSPPSVEPDAPPDLSRFGGTYQHADMLLDVSAADGALTLKASGTDHIAPFAAYALPPVGLRHVSKEGFDTVPGGEIPRPKFQFLEPDENGRPRFLHTGFRAFRRVP